MVVRCEADILFVLWCSVMITSTPTPPSSNPIQRSLPSAWIPPGPAGAPERRHWREHLRHSRRIDVDAALNNARDSGSRSNECYFDAVFRPALAAICRAPTIPWPGHAT